MGVDLKHVARILFELFDSEGTDDDSLVDRLRSGGIVKQGDDGVGEIFGVGEVEGGFFVETGSGVRELALLILQRVVSGMVTTD